MPRIQDLRSPQEPGLRRQLCDEGCLTFPHSPPDIPTGPVYQYNILHAVEPDNPPGNVPNRIRDSVREYAGRRDGRRVVP